MTKKSQQIEIGDEIIQYYEGSFLSTEVIDIDYVITSRGPRIKFITNHIDSQCDNLYCLIGEELEIV